MSQAISAANRQTPLARLHAELGARMVAFAGYDMPVHYPSGIIAEHTHCRTQAGLFDVSHMGQVRITGADPAGALERLVPGDIAGLGVGAMRYTLFTNGQGGILDDLMATRRENDLFLVVNAGTKEADVAHLEFGLADCHVNHLTDRALLAVQGPAAAGILARLAPPSSKLMFMSGAAMAVAGFDCFVTRSGYTGEDGFEISCLARDAEALAHRLLAAPELAPAGLGARDSLRLEAGLCLYGHDIDRATTPIEAGLAWTIPKTRRAGGGFPGADIIARQLQGAIARKRVGILPEGRAPAREGTIVQDKTGRPIGRITSGGFGPTVGGPIAMGYVETALAGAGQAVDLVVRGKKLPGKVARLPFVAHRYVKS